MGESLLDRPSLEDLRDILTSVGEILLLADATHLGYEPGIVGSEPVLEVVQTLGRLKRTFCGISTLRSVCMAE